MDQNIKNTLRSEMIKKRKNMSSEDANIYSKEIINTLINMDIFKNSKNIMLYLSFKNEVDTFRLVEICLKSNKRVIVPHCVKETIEIIPCEISDVKNNLIKTKIGVMEPDPNHLNVFSLDKLDLIIVPGVVFDENCNRIGFGAGYYDRFLSKLNKDVPTIGLCYEYQLIDIVPTNKYDIPLHSILTEKRLIKNPNYSDIY